MAKKWTDEELAILRDCYKNKVAAKEIAKRINKTITSIRTKAYRLGISETKTDYTEEERQRKSKERRKKQVESTKKWREKMKAQGLCVRCGKQEAMYKSVFCYECWEKGYDYDQTHKPSEEQYRKELEANTRRKRKNLENGLCYKCGKRPHLEGLTTCIDCHIKDVRYSQEKKRERKAIRDSTRKYRLENHLCTKCGEPAKDGYKVCERHYQVSCENSKKLDRKRFNNEWVFCNQKKAPVA